MKRTHTCGELGKKDLKHKVKLCGWVQSRRDHGGIVFIDLRDRYGLTQIVFDPKHDPNSHKIAEKLAREDVIQASGMVRDRKEGMVNSNLKTGEIEIIADTLTLFNKAETPPMEIDDRIQYSEELRMKYRFLDLRRPSVQEKIIFRHKVTQAVRNYFSWNGFTEIETPMLIRPTPEGARDYVVPSRVNPGCLYALPQSPQLYKQILMVSGLDKYFQIARCMRDEDLRTDRQPEFTQIDVEMSFPDQEDIHKLIDGLIKELFEKCMSIKIPMPIPKMTFHEAMEKYGCDKPDLRFGMELVTVTDIVKHSEFSIFKSAIDKGGVVRCLKVDNPKDFSRTKVDELIEFVKGHHAKGMAWVKIAKGKMDSSIVKYLPDDVQNKIMERTGAKEGDYLFFIADSWKVANQALSQLRNKLGKDLQMYNPKEFNFVWVVDFPLFEWDDDLEQWAPAHHMFTMPKEECMEYLESDPGKVLAQLYDLVLNGVELGSGSIRIHKKDIQERVMKVVNIPLEEAQRKFGFLLEAFKYGAPPHGGIALGLDRLVALMCGINDIREVIAFPRNKNAQNLMDGSPAAASDNDLKEVHLKWNIVKKTS